MPISASTPRMATNPNGAPEGISAATTPISPSGAAQNTTNERRNPCICNITKKAMISSISGTTAAMGA